MSVVGDARRGNSGCGSSGRRNQSYAAQREAPRHWHSTCWRRSHRGVGLGKCVMRPNWRLSAGYRYPSPRSWTPRDFTQQSRRAWKSANAHSARGDHVFWRLSHNHRRADIDVGTVAPAGASGAANLVVVSRPRSAPGIPGRHLVARRRPFRRVSPTTGRGLKCADGVRSGRSGHPSPRRGLPPLSAEHRKRRCA